MAKKCIHGETMAQMKQLLVNNEEINRPLINEVQIRKDLETDAKLGWENSRKNSEAGGETVMESGIVKTVTCAHHKTSENPVILFLCDCCYEKTGFVKLEQKIEPPSHEVVEIHTDLSLVRQRQTQLQASVGPAIAASSVESVSLVAAQAKPVEPAQQHRPVAAATGTPRPKPAQRPVATVSVYSATPGAVKPVSTGAVKLPAVAAVKPLLSPSTKTGTEAPKKTEAAKKKPRVPLPPRYDQKVAPPRPLKPDIVKKDVKPLTDIKGSGMTDEQVEMLREVLYGKLMYQQDVKKWQQFVRNETHQSIEAENKRRVIRVAAGEVKS